MAVENPIECLYNAIFGRDGPQLWSASSPAAGMAEETVAITRKAVREPSDREWLISIIAVDGQQPSSKAGSKHQIQKAPAKFREYKADKEYFDPRVVSLGPYHHSKVHLQRMEKRKITAANQFFDQFTNLTRTEGIYKKFKESIGKKELYDEEEAKKSDDVFARMMFLDGCFVLHFIDKFNEGGTTKLKISNDLIPLIIRDMFLIENQLPFQVLDALLKLRWGSSSKGTEKILDFINRAVLRHMGMYYSVRSSRSSNWLKLVERGKVRPLHILDILRTILLDFPPSKWTQRQSYIPHNFGSVMELKELGIRFEKRSIKSLMDIRYKENLLFPRLLLPKMHINDTTISQLLNLTAFEACSDTYSGCGVTSFIHFMDSLINDGADVKKLRSKDILHHSLGTDDEVADLFNTWPADVTNLKLYRDISEQISERRNSIVKISVATWVGKYFRSPWTALSLGAAVVLLVFTAIQTYLAAFPRR